MNGFHVPSVLILCAYFWISSNEPQTYFEAAVDSDDVGIAAASHFDAVSIVSEQAEMKLHVLH